MYTDPIFAQQPTHPTTPAHPAHPADLAVFVITTTLCALGALMLPLAG
jgi:hypothetical protein